MYFFTTTIYSVKDKQDEFKYENLNFENSSSVYGMFSTYMPCIINVYNNLIDTSDDEQEEKKYKRYYDKFCKLQNCHLFTVKENCTLNIFPDYNDDDDVYQDWIEESENFIRNVVILEEQ